MKALKFEDLEERMINFLKEDIKTYSTGHLELDNLYKFISSGVTDVTGYPYMGKTLVLNEILWNVTMKTGSKNLLHLPDSGKPEEVIAHLIQKDSGKTFNKGYENTIKEEEILSTLARVTEHFHILQLEKSKDGRLSRPTPYEFWEFAVREGYNTASIDSWNYMNHKSSGTDYLADVLSYRNELADRHKCHFFTIIHPKNPTKENYDSNGNLKPADGYCLMGGSEWNNNARNIISVHKESKEGSEYQVHVMKTKPRIVGKTGVAILNFDIKFQKFWTADEGKRLYAFGEMEQFIKEEVFNPTGGMPKGTDWTDEQLEKGLGYNPETGDIFNNVEDAPF
jgi:hypothetical protein